MAGFNCDVCGGKVVSSAREGWFQCENCGSEYPTEWMKAKFQKTQAIKLEDPVTIDGTVQVEGTVKVDTSSEADAMLRRTYQYLAEGAASGDWKKEKELVDRAEELVGRVLELDPENARAHIAMMRVTGKNRDAMADDVIVVDKNYKESAAYKNALRYADDEYRAILEGYAKNEQWIRLYYESRKTMRLNEGSERREKYEASNKAAQTYKNLSGAFRHMPELHDSLALADKCAKLADKCKEDAEKFAEKERVQKERQEKKKELEMEKQRIAEERKRQSEAWRRAGLCMHCGGKRHWFRGVCTVCGKYNVGGV